MVFAQQDSPSWSEDEVYRGIPIKRLDFDRIILSKEPKKFRAIEEYIEKVAKEFRPDIIHLNKCVGGVMFAFLLFRNRLSAPVVLTVHAPYESESEVDLIDRQTFAQSAQVCCVSKWVLSEMEKHAPMTKDKLRLIYNGLSMPGVEPNPLSFSPPTILLLGRLSLEKGFDTAITAFSLLKKSGSNARLIIAGGGWERPRLERLVAELGLTDVQFTREIEREQALSFLNQATLVVVPSHSESFGLVALEAMQMGRPVIASRVGGLPEVIPDEETGLFVPPRDPVALCNAIQTLLNDPEKAMRMGEKGRKWARENFTLQQHVTQYEQLYRELAP
jgi:glycogen(starch) synthase